MLYIETCTVNRLILILRDIESPYEMQNIKFVGCCKNLFLKCVISFRITLALKVKRCRKKQHSPLRLYSFVNLS